MTEYEKSMYRMRTLCEVCANAYGGCSWSKRGVQQPVEGWGAIRRDLTTFAGKYSKTPVANAPESYMVLDCPLFELEERHRWAYEKFDREEIRKEYAK